MNLLEPSDEYLITCVKDGNIEKTAILFDRHHKNIYSYFYRLTRSKAESEDLVQNVFLRLLNYRNSYKLGHQFMPWLFRIAHNVYIDYCKCKVKETACFKVLSKINDETPESNDIEEQIDRFYKAFNLLHPDYQEILILNRYQKLTYKQIGEALGQREKAVKQKAFRAMIKLRDEYNKLEISEK